MKKWILFVVGVVNILLASETKDVTVQVISAVHEKSITDAFDAKLKKTGLAIYKKVEEGKFIVTLGEYKDVKQAQPALKKVRTTVTKDAFVRLVNRTVSSETPLHDSNTTSIVLTEPSSVPVATTPVIVRETPLIAIPKVIIPTSIVSPPLQKREMRRDEISDAINFYATSSYYRFEPVILRQ